MVFFIQNPGLAKKLKITRGALHPPPPPIHTPPQKKKYKNNLIFFLVNQKSLRIAVVARHNNFPRVQESQNNFTVDDEHHPSFSVFLPHTHTHTHTMVLMLAVKKPVFMSLAGGGGGGQFYIKTWPTSSSQRRTRKRADIPNECNPHVPSL